MWISSFSRRVRATKGEGDDMRRKANGHSLPGTDASGHNDDNESQRLALDSSTVPGRAASVIARTQGCMQEVILLAHDLGGVAARSGRAQDARRATDAAQAAHILWCVAENLAVEMGAGG